MTINSRKYMKNLGFELRSLPIATSISTELYPQIQIGCVVNAFIIRSFLYAYMS